MSEEYVRKDVYEEAVKRLDEKYVVMFEAMRDRIADLKQEVREAKDIMIRGWTIIGVIAALSAFALTALQFYFAIRGNR